MNHPDDLCGFNYSVVLLFLTLNSLIKDEPFGLGLREMGNSSTNIALVGLLRRDPMSGFLTRREPEVEEAHCL